jgi:hypothetical protein
MPSPLNQVYVADFTYDTGNRKVLLIITNAAGEQLLRIDDVPNVNHIWVEDGEDLVADFSFTGHHNPLEQPQIGWQYRNLTMEAYPE